MTPLRRLLAVAALAVALPVLVVWPAQADAGESINSYVVTATVATDGTMAVTEIIDYDFGGNQRHGIYRTIPVRYPYDDTYDRVLEVDQIQVTSDAPADLETSNEGDTLVLRIGDPDRTVSGPHTYTISYRVRGALNAFPDHVELSWNAIGAEWDAPIARARVTVTMPGDVTDAVCFEGPTYSQLPCDLADAEVDPVLFADQARFEAYELSPYEGLTVVVGAPLDSVDAGAAEPILDERFSVTRAFAITPATVAGALTVLVLGVGGVLLLVWQRGRDRRWPGVTPGLDPPSGTSGEERRPLFTAPEGAIEFRPPRDLRPGQVGLLLDERADVLDVSSSVVDLAVRGYLRIEELPREGWFHSRDWRLVWLGKDPAGLLPYESRLLGDLFASGNDVLLSDLKQHFAPQLAQVRKDLEADAVSQGFFRSRPATTRLAWGVVGAVALALGVGLTYLLAVGTHAGLIGLAVIVVGALLLFFSGRMPARTAKGSAAYAQVLGFRRYVATAEVEQLRYEESVDVFSRYLPYAMVFGETDRWAKALAGLAAAQVATAGVSSLGWYVGPTGWDFGSLGSSLGSFAESSGSTFAASAASSGGSGGFSGGGFGGGGGGSW
ncbi:MAG TPA: DUF2207 domain-containing protein [Candidatus Limnocylindria bacterium]|nr:DUF2207 domain-containing protein [Candidatus Limnocylindria bacterium]